MAIGRPPIEIDWKYVDELLEAGSSGLEISGTLGIDSDTFYYKMKEKYGMAFSAYSAMKYSKGEGKIRLAQYRKAIGESKKGDTQLLLFLGRVRLKQIEAQAEKIQDIPPNDKFIELEKENIELRHENRNLKNAVQS